MGGETGELMESGGSGGWCKYCVVSTPLYSGNVLLHIPYILTQSNKKMKKM